MLLVTHAAYTRKRDKALCINTSRTVARGLSAPSFLKDLGLYAPRTKLSFRRRPATLDAPSVYHYSPTRGRGFKKARGLRHEDNRRDTGSPWRGIHDRLLHFNWRGNSHNCCRSRVCVLATEMAAMNTMMHRGLVLVSHLPRQKNEVAARRDRQLFSRSYVYVSCYRSVGRCHLFRGII